jgi:ABC-type uncharacterized transport system permease subunit
MEPPILAVDHQSSGSAAATYTSWFVTSTQQRRVVFFVELYFLFPTVFLDDCVEFICGFYHEKKITAAIQREIDT